MALYRNFGYIGELVTNAFILKEKAEDLKVKGLIVLFASAVKDNEEIGYSNIKLSFKK